MFSKYFDESLWFILETDIEKRGEIVSFLNRIPSDLVDEVRDILSDDIEYDRGELDPVYEGSVVSDDGSIYSYLLELDEEESVLEIKQHFATPDDCAHINLSVELNLVKSTPGSEVFDEERFWIGNFTKAFSVVGCDLSSLRIGENRFLPVFSLLDGELVPNGQTMEIEYEYYIFGDQSNINKFDCSNGSSVISPIDVNAVPDEITLDYINRKYGDLPKTKHKLPDNK